MLSSTSLSPLWIWNTLRRTRVSNTGFKLRRSFLVINRREPRVASRVQVGLLRVDVVFPFATGEQGSAGAVFLLTVCTSRRPTRRTRSDKPLRRSFSLSVSK